MSYSFWHWAGAVSFNPYSEKEGTSLVGTLAADGQDINRLYADLIFLEYSSFSTKRGYSLTHRWCYFNRKVEFWIHFNYW